MFLGLNENPRCVARSSRRPATGACHERTGLRLRHHPARWGAGRGRLLQPARQDRDCRAARRPARRRHRSGLSGRLRRRARGRGSGGERGEAAPPSARWPARWPATSTRPARRCAGRGARASTSSSTAATCSSRSSCARAARTCSRWRARRSRARAATRRTSSSARWTPPAPIFDFVAEVVAVALDAGATTINIPDTVGWILPDRLARAAARPARARPAARGGRALVPRPGRSGPGDRQLPGRRGRRRASGRAGRERDRRARRQRRLRGGGDGARACTARRWACTARSTRRGICELSRLVEERSGIAVPPNKPVVGATPSATPRGSIRTA